MTASSFRWRLASTLLGEDLEDPEDREGFADVAEIVLRAPAAVLLLYQALYWYHHARTVLLNRRLAREYPRDDPDAKRG